VKAAVLRAYGQAPVYADVPDPVPGAGEELIEVTAAPVNNIDKVRADGTLLFGWRARPEPGATVLVLAPPGSPAAWPCRPPAATAPAG